MKVFASFYKKKRCLSFARGRPTNPARKLSFARGRPANPARKLSFARGRPANPARKMFFFEKKTKKLSFMEHLPGDRPDDAVRH
jgi:hypothetical protein